MAEFYPSRPRVVRSVFTHLSSVAAAVYDEKAPGEPPRSGQAGYPVDVQEVMLPLVQGVLSQPRDAPPGR